MTSPIIGLTNTLDPAAPGIIEENLLSSNPLRKVVEHVLLERVDRGHLRTADEVDRWRDFLIREFSAPRFSDELAEAVRRLELFEAARRRAGGKHA